VFHIALYEPEIPPNTGNIIRLCANTGAQLHLIHPLGFTLQEKALRRAGLDYHEWASLREHIDFKSFCQQMPQRIVAVETGASIVYSDFTFAPGDVLLFGPETRGLPAVVLEQFLPEQCVSIPMLPHSRSLNLSNAVAVVLFEALRQQRIAQEK